MKKIKNFFDRMLAKTKEYLKDKKNWQPIAGLLIAVLFVGASTAFGRFYRTQEPTSGFSYGYGYGYGYEEGYGYGYGYHQGQGLANYASYGFWGADGKASDISVSGKTENSLTISYTTSYTAKNRIEYGTATSSLGSYNPSSNWSSSAINCELSGTHSLTLTGLASSTTYYYKVETKDAGGKVWYTATKTATTTAGEIAITPETASSTAQVKIGGVITTTEGMFSTLGVTSTSFSKATLGAPVSSDVTLSVGAVGMSIPAGTVVYAATSTFTSIPAPSIAEGGYTSTSALTTSGGTSYNPIGSVIEFGIPNVSLIFSKLVTVTIPGVTETPAKVIYSVDGNTWYAISQCNSTDISATSTPIFPGACFGYSTDIITLETYHFTKFAGAGAATISIPTVTSGSASSISQTSAILSGNITATGGENATARGFEYGKNTSYGSTVSETGSFSTGSFSLSISGLDCGTTYHFKAFATNSGGTGDDSDKTFTTDACAGGGGAGGGGGDTSVPAISNIGVLVGDTFATVSWKTNKASLSWIVYGTTTAYGLENKTTSYVTSHSLTLSDLSLETTYHYQIKSKDKVGNVGFYTDKVFTTLSLGEKPVKQGEGVKKPIAAMTAGEVKTEITQIQSFLIQIIQNLIAKLKAELARLSPLKTQGIPDSFTFQKNLSYGMSNQDVVYLKSVLSNQGCLSGVKNTKWFGSKTKKGVQCLCQKHKDEISKFAGYPVKCSGLAGKGVRAELNQLLGR